MTPSHTTSSLVSCLARFAVAAVCCIAPAAAAQDSPSTPSRGNTFRSPERLWPVSPNIPYTTIYAQPRVMRIAAWQSDGLGATEDSLEGGKTLRGVSAAPGLAPSIVLPREPSADLLAAVIHAADPDVFMVLDVVPESSSDEPPAVLRAAVERLNEIQPTASWKTRLMPNAPFGVPVTTTRHHAIVWNDALVELPDRPRLIVPLRTHPQVEGTLWPTAPSYVLVRARVGGADAIIIPISMSRGETEQAGLARNWEFEGLARVLPRAADRYGEPDVIILGDTGVDDDANETLHYMTDIGNPARALNRKSMRQLAVAGDRTYAHGGGPDRVFVTSAEPELMHSGFFLFGPEQVAAKQLDSDSPLAPLATWRGWSNALSAHAIVYTEMDIGPDSDPNSGVR